MFKSIPQNEAVTNFARNKRGNVAMMWALVGAVLLGLIGITVDFTRAQMIRTQMQNAADGAALVAERSSNLSLADRTAAAKAFFDAEMGTLAQGSHFTVTQLSTGGHRVEANVPMDLSLAALVRPGPWNIAVNAEAQADASPPIEVAMVLDNTGSMVNDMAGLRTAATNLADMLLSLDGDSVKVALVPFVAQVNIGNEPSHLAWMDQAGQAPYNGEALEDRRIAYRDITTSGNNQTGANCEKLSSTPYAGYAGGYQVTWQRGTNLLSGILGGGGLPTRCYAWTPPDGINYLHLFDLIPNDDWKGCVEARPEPYDVDDTVPDAGTPASMFVPFFWLDTTDNYSNSYYTDTIGDIRSATLNDNHTPPAATMTTGDSDVNPNRTLHRQAARMLNVFKYNNTSASITTGSSNVRGPNRGCPTPIVPLTTNRGTIMNNISQMTYWNGGGTNQAEGLAWGWRVLSPTPPFTEGAAYGPNVRKVLVLMSDGENTNVGDDPVLESDYSAYNHRGVWDGLANGSLLNQLLGGIVRGLLPAQYQRNITSQSSYVTYVNNRERQVCTNIKAAGIEIYTVIFRETDPATVSLMRSCASGDNHFYRADNAAELNNAFHAIGTGIGQLRLTH